MSPLIHLSLPQLQGFQLLLAQPGSSVDVHVLLYEKFQTVRIQIILIRNTRLLTPTIDHRHTSLYCASWIVCFLQIEGETLHQQKDHNSLYCNDLDQSL